MNHRRGDRTIGIVLGILIGVAVVVAFVFLGSESTVDAPSIKGAGQGSTGAQTTQPPQTGTPLVRVISGGPPESGPPRLDFKKGEQVHFKVTSDSAVDIEVLGIPGQEHNVPTGGTVVFKFKAKKAGLFAVLIPATHIGVASIQVSK